VSADISANTSAHTSADILRTVDAYYSAKVREHGPSPRGVDWNSEESQRFRFEQLLRIRVDDEWADDGPFSVLDYGCGYGALVDHLDALGRPFRYLGFDVSEEMIRVARERYPDRPDVAFTSAAADLVPADYCVASGIFNVRLATPDDAWLAYIHATLDRLDQLGRRGFAFNALTSYSDVEKMRPDLYYTDAPALFDRCKRRYSRFVALLHDYPLYEFTMLVRKEQVWKGRA
jgi:SAM-dependent methyltransferase